MVFNGARLLGLVRLVAPALYRSFEQLYAAIGTPKESEVTERLYRNMSATNFSRGLLEPLSRHHGSSLLVLPVRGVLWSDWGSEQRIMSILRKIGRIERIPEAAELVYNV
jgi:hypothetical protein